MRSSWRRDIPTSSNSAVLFPAAVVTWSGGGLLFSCITFQRDGKKEELASKRYYYAALHTPCKCRDASSALPRYKNACAISYVTHTRMFDRSGDVRAHASVSCVWPAYNLGAGCKSSWDVCIYRCGGLLDRR